MLRIFEGANAMTVDGSEDTRKVDRRAGRTIHFGGGKMAEPLGIWGPDTAEALLALITARVQALKAARSCGSVLFITPAREVYLLSEESPQALDWELHHTRWWVGVYCPKRVKLTAPHCLGEVVELDLSGLAEDIAEHLQGLPA